MLDRVRDRKRPQGVFCLLRGLFLAGIFQRSGYLPLLASSAILIPLSVILITMTVYVQNWTDGQLNLAISTK
jgi:hypothetical protein